MDQAADVAAAIANDLDELNEDNSVPHSDPEDSDDVADAGAAADDSDVELGSTSQQVRPSLHIVCKCGGLEYEIAWFNAEVDAVGA